jgi:membrane fusion protein (multidrug efflux system)
MRVTGFPWTEFGSLIATVTAVSSEVMDGRIRVELSLDVGQRSTIPVRHGLIGEVEVELESMSPAALVMRGAGQLSDDWFAR